MKITFSLFVFCSSYFFADAQRQLVFADKNHSFKLTLDSISENNWGHPDSTVKSITVTRLRDHKIIQTIIPGENFVSKGSVPELVIEDANFDGHNDFELFAWEAKHGQTGYLFFLFDPQKEQFNFSKEIAEVLDDAHVDQKSKTLSKMYRIGGGHYESVVYCFIHGKLTLIEQREDEHMGDYYRVTMKKRIKGKMVTIQNKKYSERAYQNYPDRLIPGNN